MSRAGKTAEGSHEYEIATGITACLMGNDQWTLFRRRSDGVMVDTGIDCKSLEAARKYAKDHNWMGAQ